MFLVTEKSPTLVNENGATQQGVVYTTRGPAAIRSLEGQTTAAGGGWRCASPTAHASTDVRSVSI